MCGKYNMVGGERSDEVSLNVCSEPNYNINNQAVENPYYGNETNTTPNNTSIGRPCSFMNDTEIITSTKNDYYAI